MRQNNLIQTIFEKPKLFTQRLLVVGGLPANVWLDVDNQIWIARLKNYWPFNFIDPLSQI